MSDKQQALELLYEAAQIASLPKMNHIRCQQAYELLKQAVQEQPKEEVKK